MIPPTHKKNIFVNLIQLRKFLSIFGFNPFYILLPSLLALVAAILEGVSLGLLIPMTKGIINRDFEFVHDNFFLKNIFIYLPDESANRNSTIFIVLIGFIFMAASTKCIFQYFSSLSAYYQLQRFANNLRKNIYNRYLNFGMLYFDKHNLGYLYQVLVVHSAQVCSMVNGLHSAIYLMFTLIVYLFMLFMISWKVTLLVTILFPILHFTLRWLIERIKYTSEAFVESFSDMCKKISNALSCMPLVKAYSSEKRESAWFSHTSDVCEMYQNSIGKKRLLIGPLQEIITLFIILLLTAFIAFIFIRENSGAISGYVVFFIILRRLIGAFGFFNDFRGSIAEVEGPIREITKVFSDKDKYFVSEGKEIFNGLQKNIRFKNLKFSYIDGIPIIKDLTLNLKKGCKTAIVGATGSGKTTLISLLMRYYESPPGAITIDGTDIRNFTLESISSHIALVSQVTMLFNAPLRINLTYGIADERIADDKIQQAINKSRLDGLFATLPKGLETEIGDRGVRLSEGEKQRISIARAILKNAQILILDEATSALDSKTEKLIRDALDELMHDKTAIIIAHRLATIRNVDKIIVIENGKLEEEGTLKELLDKKGRFFQYWKEQMFF